MIRNYFNTALRMVVKNRIYSLINIVGLTIGLAACMIVATVVIDDLSYDRQWSKSDNLYRIIKVDKMGSGVYNRSAASPSGLANRLTASYPEVEAAATMMTTVQKRFKLNGNDANGVEVVALLTDTSFWRMLDAKVIAGNPEKYDDENENIVITETFRNKFFAKENPVGKIIYDVPTYQEKSSYLITGVIKDFPSNTVLRAEIIMLHGRGRAELNKDQSGNYSENYVLMKPGTDVEKFTDRLNKWYASFVSVKSPSQFEFQSMKDIYLHSDFAERQVVKGSYRNIFILSGVALLLLIIACVNFTNLTTARAVQRLSETGVRKILGAGRKQLIGQFLTESILFFVFSTLFATMIYQVSLHPVENYLGHPLAQTFLSKTYLLAVTICVILLISLLTGLYPAWMMSGFNPAATIKGNLFAGNSTGQSFVRKGLVVLQFSISVMVLIALIIVQQQVTFMKNKDIGFSKNNLISIGRISWDNKGSVFKNELLHQHGVLNASITSWMPTTGAGNSSIEIDDPNDAGGKLVVSVINGDMDLAQTLGLHLQSGRFFDKSFAMDAISQDSLMQMDSSHYVATASAQSSLITAYTAKLLRVSSLGKSIKSTQTTPVGIVADFNSESLKNPMEPTIIISENSPSYGGMLVRIQPGSQKYVIASINKLWKQFYPEKLLEIKWVDEMLDNQYKEESKLQTLFSFFSGLTMFLATLGIFGLVVQATARRVKEIGIRKVLGASINSIVRFFSIDFLKLILIAIIIASPVAWWLMSKWLLDFANRIQISWSVFVMAGLTAICVALLTISFQAIKAAVANPVKSLKSD